MDEDESEMARLRQSRKYQAFDDKFNRTGARIHKQEQQQKLDQQQSLSSPSPPPHAQTQSQPQPQPQQPENDDNTHDNNDDEDLLRLQQSLPTAFGKPSKLHSQPGSDVDSSNVRAELDAQFEADVDHDNDGERTQFQASTQQYLQQLCDEHNIPLKYVAKFKGHQKAISSMCLDRSGTRLITGSLDFTLRFWDFGGMNESLQSFRSITPCEGYAIRSVAYNHSGSLVLCCPSSHKPLIFDRDGRKLHEFVQGDMYICDLNHTLGHTMPLMGGKWFGPNHLRENCHEIATWSQDSTFRIWDVESSPKHCKQIIKARNKSGKRVSVTCADFGSGIHRSFLIALACNDGSIQLFDHKSHCQRPKKIIADAHVNGSDTSYIGFDRSDPNMFISRGGLLDSTMKLWDVRNVSRGEPVHTWTSMENVTSRCNVVESPDHRLYVTLCSNRKDERTGKSVLCVIDKQSRAEIVRIPISDRAINHVLWHPKINQLFVAGNDANVRAYYEDAPRSKNGVLLCAKRKYKKQHLEQQMQYFKIINPNALRVYKKRSQVLEDKRRKDLLKHQPEGPHVGIGVGGRINTESFSAMVYRSQEKNVMSQVDPRDRLLLFDEKAKQEPQFTSIYSINQPKPVFQLNDEHDIEANQIVNQLYTNMPGARQYNAVLEEEENKSKDSGSVLPPPAKKQKR